jgi:hypothetical protein
MNLLKVAVVSVVSLSVFGCGDGAPLLEAIKVPKPSSENASAFDFEPGQATSIQNFWVKKSDFSLNTYIQQISRYDGSKWTDVAVPSALTEDASVPSFEIEALPTGDALIFGHRKTHELLAYKVTPAGALTDLSSAFTSLRWNTGGGNSPHFVKKGDDVYALVVASMSGSTPVWSVFKYDGAAMVAADASLAPELLAIDEAFFSAPLRRGDTLWARGTIGGLSPSDPADSEQGVSAKVSRKVGDGSIETVTLSAEAGDLETKGSVDSDCGGYTCGTGNGPSPIAYTPVGLVPGEKDSLWLAINHTTIVDNQEGQNRIIFRKIDGLRITKEERFGFDLKACNVTPQQPECSAPRALSFSNGTFVFTTGFGGLRTILKPTGSL